MASFSGHHGFIFGAPWHDFGGHFGIIWGSFSRYFRVILVTFWDHFGIILGGFFCSLLGCFLLFFMSLHAFACFCLFSVFGGGVFSWFLCAFVFGAFLVAFCTLSARLRLVLPLWFPFATSGVRAKRASERSVGSARSDDRRRRVIVANETIAALVREFPLECPTKSDHFFFLSEI